MLQKTAEFFPALDGTASQGDRCRLLARGFQQCSIISSLVRPAPVVKGLEPFDDVAQMIDAKAYEVVEAFPADRLHEPLGERVQIRLFRPDADDLQILALERRPEPSREL